MIAKRILVITLLLSMLLSAVGCSTTPQSTTESESTLTTPTNTLSDTVTPNGSSTTPAGTIDTLPSTDIDIVLSATDMKLYENSYNILYNRITDRGYAITSLTGTYVGMFSRDSAIQAMAHLSCHDTDSARAILKYLLSYHAVLGLDRTTHIIDNIKDEEYRNNYLNTSGQESVNYYQEQTEPGIAQFMINAPNNSAATPFISNKRSVDSVQAYLEGAVSSKVIAEIFTDLMDPDTLVATGTYTFTDAKAGWKTIKLDKEVSFDKNTTYYLKLHAPSGSGKVVWYGINNSKSGYLKSFNYDIKAYGGNGWLEVGVYTAFIIGESDNQVTESYVISQRNSETPLYIINAPKNGAAQKFVPKNKLIYGVDLNLTKTNNSDTVKVFICTDYKNKDSAIAEATYTFNSNENGWQTILFDNPVSVTAGKTYYLVLEATSTSGKVVWNGTTNNCGSMNSYNYDVNSYNGWKEQSYYPAFEIISYKSETIAKGFESRGNKISEIELTVNSPKAKGKLKVEIRTDYTDANTTLGYAEVAIDKAGEKKYTLTFDKDITVSYKDYCYIVVTLIDTETGTRLMSDTKAAADSYYYDGTWHRLGYDILINPNFDVDKEAIITIDKNTAGIQEIPCNGEIITSVSVLLSRDNDAKGFLKATLYKGSPENGQLIDSKTINVNDIPLSADWVNIKFELPLFKISTTGNYFIKLEGVDSTGNVYWCGSTTVDNLSTNVQTKDGTKTVQGEAGFEAYRSEIKLISNYTQTDANYMLIHAWVMYVNNNKGTPEDIQFINQSYPIIKKFANYYIDSKQYYNEKMNLLLNPSLEHSRKIRYWVSYDLLTNVFASQALHELSQVAKTMKDNTMSEKWATYAKKIENGINTNLVTEYDGLKIYDEFYDVEDNMKFYAGISWVNLAPIAAEWYGMDLEIMKNTYEIYKKYASVNMYGSSCLATEATLGTNELTKELIGKGNAWELMFCSMIGDYERIEEIVALERETAKRNNITVYPEFWKNENYVTDPGNQEHCSWQVYAMSKVFKDLPLELFYS